MKHSEGAHSSHKSITGRAQGIKVEKIACWSTQQQINSVSHYQEIQTPMYGEYPPIKDLRLAYPPKKDKARQNHDLVLKSDMGPI